MQLRWSAGIALWTILSGPVLSERGISTAPSREPSRPVVKKIHHKGTKDTKKTTEGKINFKY